MGWDGYRSPDPRSPHLMTTMRKQNTYQTVGMCHKFHGRNHRNSPMVGLKPRPVNLSAKLKKKIKYSQTGPSCNTPF